MLNVDLQESGGGRVTADLDALTLALSNMHEPLLAATDVIYEHTRQWFEQRGDGSWPPLAESTIQRKASQGYAQPARPLYALGDLFESATSAHGPYSFRIVEARHAVIGIDWASDGVQIPTVLSEGDEAHGLPARPIFQITDDLVLQLEEVLHATVMRETALVA